MPIRENAALNSAALLAQPAAHKNDLDNRDQTDFGAELGALLTTLAPPPANVKAAIPPVAAGASGKSSRVNSAAAEITAAGIAQPLAPGAVVRQFAPALKASAGAPVSGVPAIAQGATLAAEPLSAGKIDLAQVNLGQIAPAIALQLGLAPSVGNQTKAFGKTSSAQNLLDNSPRREAPGFVLTAASSVEPPPRPANGRLSAGAPLPLEANARPGSREAEGGGGHATSITHHAPTASGDKTADQTDAKPAAAPDATAISSASASTAAKTLAVASPLPSHQPTFAATPVPAVVSRPANEIAAAPRIVAATPLALAREVAPPSEPVRTTALKIDLADGASARVSVRARSRCGSSQITRRSRSVCKARSQPCAGRWTPRGCSCAAPTSAIKAAAIRAVGVIAQRLATAAPPRSPAVIPRPGKTSSRCER